MEKIKKIKIKKKLFQDFGTKTLDTRLEVRVFPEIVQAIDIIVNDKTSPYLDRSDFIRGAIVMRIRQEVDRK